MKIGMSPCISRVGCSTSRAFFSSPSLLPPQTHAPPYIYICTISLLFIHSATYLHPPFMYPNTKISLFYSLPPPPYYFHFLFSVFLQGSLFRCHLLVFTVSLRMPTKKTNCMECMDCYCKGIVLLLLCCYYCVNFLIKLMHLCSSP